MDSARDQDYASGDATVRPKAPAPKPPAKVQPKEEPPTSLAPIVNDEEYVDPYPDSPGVSLVAIRLAVKHEKQLDDMKHELELVSHAIVRRKTTSRR